MIDQVRRYKKALKKDLCCCGIVKKQLLERFDLSLSAFLEDAPSPTMDQLCAAFGPPKEMAKILMATLPPNELVRYHRKTLLTKIAIWALVFLFLLGGVVLYIEKSAPVEIHDGLIIDEPIAIDETADPSAMSTE